MTQMAKTLGSSLEGMLGNPPFQSNPYLVAYDDANDEAKAFGPGTPANLKESALQRHGIRIQDVTTQFLSVQRGTGQDRLKTQIANTQQQGVSENLRLVAALACHGPRSDRPAALDRGGPVRDAGALARARWATPGSSISTRRRGARSNQRPRLRRVLGTPPLTIRSRSGC